MSKRCLVAPSGPACTAIAAVGTQVAGVLPAKDEVRGLPEAPAFFPVSVHVADLAGPSASRRKFRESEHAAEKRSHQTTPTTPDS